LSRRIYLAHAYAVAGKLRLWFTGARHTSREKREEIKEKS
jgi:hypothetical protein